LTTFAGHCIKSIQGQSHGKKKALKCTKPLHPNDHIVWSKLFSIGTDISCSGGVVALVECSGGVVTQGHLLGFYVYIFSFVV
jgi:hypothetical protein